MRWMALLLLAPLALAQDASLAEAEKKMQAKDYEGALAAYDKAIAEAPDDPRGHAGRAGALSALKRPDDALKSITRAIELKPDGRYYRHRAYIHLVREDEAAAISDYTRGIEVAPEMGGLYRGRADVLYGQHDYAGAANDYQKAYELDARDLTALERLGQTRESLRDFKGAIAAFTDLAYAAPHHPRPFQLRGEVKLAVGDYQGAVDDFDAAIYNEEGSEERGGQPYVFRARAKLGLGKKEEADADARKAVEVDDGASTYDARGRYYFDTGRPKEAAADLAKAVAKETRDADYTRFFLFLARARNGERAAAAAELKAYADGREKKDDWYTKVAAFLTGQMKEDAFLAAARAENANLAREQECESSWYAAAVRMLDGDAAGARPLLERCVATDVRNFIEHESATMALAAMER
ncbi:MAG TPA: tetratricopeptide repeat protein [Planctomycetota bacterium]|nr:tetratricopeptide repeat protein [Planctomycetota bacterium]